MKPVIKSLYSSLVPDSIEGTKFDPCDCWIPVIADIGTAESDGSDAFTFTVCTANFLKRHVEEGEPLFDGRMIIVNKFDWQEVEHVINKICQGISGNTWLEVCIQFLRYAEHEHEREILEEIASKLQ